MRRARAGPGRGRLRADAARLPARLPRCAAEHGILYVDDEVQSGVGRHGEGLGDRALRRRRARPARLGQVDRRRAPARGRHRSRGADGRRARPAASAARSAATRSRVRPRSPCSRRSREPEFLDRAARLGEMLRTRLDALAAAHPRSARCAGSGRCSRSSSRSGPGSREGDRRRGVRARPAPALVRAVRERHPAPAPADDRRRGARRGPRPARGVARGSSLGDRTADRHPHARPSQALRRCRGGRRSRPGRRTRRVLHAARPVGVGQDDDAADDRRVRAAGRGHGRARRPATSPGCRRSTATSTPCSRTTRCSRT